MNLEIKGQVVLITGGAGGIGAALSTAFANEGAKVAITYHQNKDAAEELVEQLQTAGHESMAIAYDMGDYAQAQIIVNQVVSKWGRLDAVIANAVEWPMLEQPIFADTDFQAWAKAVDGNLHGTAALLQQAAKQMVQQNYGRIVVMSSEIAIDGMPGTTSYSTAKAAIHGLVASLRWELGPQDIFINFVSPGFNMTPKNLQRFPDEVRQQVAAKAPTGRLSVPEDVAPTVLFLASKANKHMTGEFLSVSGGAH
jgi:3-oxoacyl-[acyl-carrier protein] reductase